MHCYSYEVNLSSIGTRLDRFLGERVTELSREKIKKAIEAGHCRINDIVTTSPSTRLKIGQCIYLCVEMPTAHIQPERGTVHVVWHDAHMLLCHKPAGITVHPCPSCPEGTLIQRLAWHFPLLLQQEGLRPGIVHRLDKNTSGLLAIALNETARLRLSEDFAQRKVHKEYLALVHGIPPASGEIKEPVGRHPLIKVKMAVVPLQKGGRNAHSAWQTLYSNKSKNFSLVCVRIFTGRTHQIRVHMAHLGFPLIGDTLYGAKNNSIAPRQMLHAWKLSLPHPHDGHICDFTCPPPSDMINCAALLCAPLQKVILTGLPGCGKSTLLQAFAKLNIATWSADAVVAQLYMPNGAGHAFLWHRYGTRFVPHITAAVDKQALRKAMQEDTHLRQEIEKNIHELVRQDLDAFWARCTEQSLNNTASTQQNLAVAEVPLYLEKGWHTQSTEDWIHIVGVSCAQKLRYARLAKHRNWSTEQCQSMDSWQWPEDKKMAACTNVVPNDKKIEDIYHAATNLLSLWTTKKNTTKQIAYGQKIFQQAGISIEQSLKNY